VPLPLSSSANQNAYATSIASALQQFVLWDPSFSLNADPESAEKQIRDLVIGGAVDVLCRSIVGHQYSFEPDESDKQSRDLAGVIHGLTRRQRYRSQCWYNMARASHRGASWGLAYPERQRLKLGDGKEREWTVIGKVRDVDKRRFRLTQAQVLSSQGKATPGEEKPLGQNDPRVYTRAERDAPTTQDVSNVAGYDAGALGNFRWEMHRGGGVQPSQTSFFWQPLDSVAPLDRWLQHVVDTSEWGMSYGYALADELQFYAWAKTRVIQFGLQGLERWGQGFLWAQTKALRDGFAKGAGQATALQSTIDALRKYRSENLAATDDLTEVKLLDMPATAAANVLAWIEYLDRELVKRILAALQPTGGSDKTGGFSSAKVEEGSLDSRILYLRQPLEESWTRTYVRFLIEHNEDNLKELGLWGIPEPRLSLKGKQQRDPAQMIEVFKLARDLRVPVKVEEFREAFELTAPNEGDQVIDYDAAAAAGIVPGSQPPDPLKDILRNDGFDARRPIGEGKSSVAEKNGVAA